MRFVERAGVRGHVIVSGVIAHERFKEVPSIAFEGAVGERLDFTRASIEIFTAAGSRFADCDFRYAKLGGGGLGSAGRQTVYSNCRFDHADLRQMWDLGNVRFESCVFDYAKIHGWWADAPEFVDCHFAGKLTQCRFAGRPWAPAWAEPGRLVPPRSSNDFRGNDFRNAQLVDCSFVYGVPLASNAWPDGDGYVRLDRWQERVTLARSVVASWPEADSRETALDVLRIYSGHGFAEQDEIIVRRYDLPRIPKELADRVWAVLASAVPTPRAADPS